MSRPELQFEDPKSIKTLLYVAAMAALAFVLASVAIPVFPNVHFQFGLSIVFITAVTAGPLYGFIVGAVAITYTALVLWGDATVLLGWGMIAMITSISSKKINLGQYTFYVSCLIGAIVFGLPYWVITEYFISGLPWEIIVAIQIKSFVSALVNGLIAWAILKIPGIGKYIPVCYDSIPGRTLIEKGNL